MLIVFSVEHTYTHAHTHKEGANQKAPLIQSEPLPPVALLLAFLMKATHKGVCCVGQLNARVPAGGQLLFGTGYRRGADLLMPPN